MPMLMLEQKILAKEALLPWLDELRQEKLATLIAPTKRWGDVLLGVRKHKRYFRRYRSFLAYADKVSLPTYGALVQLSH